MKLANSLVRNAVTRNACEEYHTKLENICICSNVKNWIDIWHKRCFHFVSAFRDFFLPGVNLAKAGQVGMKCQQSHRLLALVDATQKDISAQMCQDELCRATIENCTSARGWAHTQAQKQANEHWAQESRVLQYLADLQNGNPWLEETIIKNLNEFDPDENSGHANEDGDVDVDMIDEVAEEEELQAITSIKWTRHQEEIVLKLSHPRLKPKLYSPINPKPKLYHPSGPTHRYA